MSAISSPTSTRLSDRFDPVTARKARSRDNSPDSQACELMSNRLNPSFNDALEARRAISAEVRERLRLPPPTPFDWSGFDPATALQGNSGATDLRLVALGQLLCTAPARSAELRAMWKE